MDLLVRLPTACSNQPLRAALPLRETPRFEPTAGTDEFEFDFPVIVSRQAYDDFPVIIVSRQAYDDFPVIIISRQFTTFRSVTGFQPTLKRRIRTLV
jgi:hypothetical protein